MEWVSITRRKQTESLEEKNYERKEEKGFKEQTGQERTKERFLSLN